MAKSTQILADSKALQDGSFSALSKAKAISATGPMQELNGMGNLVYNHYLEALNILTVMKAGMDAGDPLLTQVQQLIDVSV